MTRASLMFLVAIAIAVMLAQPVSAAALNSVVEDPVGDAVAPGFAGQPYQDVVRAELTLRGDRFVLAMDLAAPVPDSPALPPQVVLMMWNWNLDTDPTTFPGGFPFTPADTIPPEFMVWLLWDGTSFSGSVVDRRPLLTGGEAIIMAVPFRIKGAEVIWSVDAALLDNPSNFAWKIRTIDWFGPFGSHGVKHLDAAPDDPIFAAWPS